MSNGKLIVRYEFISSSDAQWEQTLLDEVERLSRSLPIEYSGNASERTDVLFLMYQPYAHESLISSKEIESILDSCNFPEDPYVVLIACGPYELPMDQGDVRTLGESALTSIARRYHYRHLEIDSLRESVESVIRVAVRNTDHLRSVEMTSPETDEANDMIETMQALADLRYVM